MATLLFTAVGTLVGGPLGGAIGALAGRQVDAAIIGGGPSREGARLKDLQVTTSSYGQAIPRHFGQVRTAGTIIWSTDLIERQESQGGGKGKPDTTTFSYSVSFAVALSSTPITRIGRIWADGNLVTRTGGALTNGGTMRLYTGRGDQAVDPLIASDTGAATPAFRGIAYAVFEDLPLGDFGNRIPALTFELFAQDSSLTSGALTRPLALNVTGDATFERLAGFSHEGGSVRSALSLLDIVYPVNCDISGQELKIERRLDTAEAIATLPETATIAAPGGHSGHADAGQESSHDRDGSAAHLSAVRYYDIQRDYQPSLQRATRSAASAKGRTLEFPGTLAADDALRIVDDAAARGSARVDTVRYRIAELDPAIRPGSVVRLPARAGRWIVESWEWYDAGIELELSRIRSGIGADAAADAGTITPVPEPAPAPTWLSAFELPWDGTGPSTQRQVYAAASAANPGWRGAALYDASTPALEQIASTSRARSIVGAITTALPPSNALLFEASSQIEVELLAPDMAFASADTTGLSNGRNRLLVGSEILQFARAQQIGAARWRLTGLLRGRAGTESEARGGQDAGTSAILLDTAIQQLPAERLGGGAEESIAAIGRFDQEAVVAQIDTRLSTLAPLIPVHPRIVGGESGAVRLCWTRRARGRWAWRPGVDIPLVESQERYLVGLGNIADPARSWNVEAPSMEWDAGAWAALQTEYPGQSIWVRQIGDFALSAPLLLIRLP